MWMMPLHLHINKKSYYDMMRNARFGPLTLLMTLRFIDVKSDDKFMRLFYASIYDADIRF